jgi:hypothetical protein
MTLIKHSWKTLNFLSSMGSMELTATIARGRPPSRMHPPTCAQKWNRLKMTICWRMQRNNRTEAHMVKANYPNMRNFRVVDYVNSPIYIYNPSIIYILYYIYIAWYNLITIHIALYRLYYIQSQVYLANSSFSRRSNPSTSPEVRSIGPTWGSLIPTEGMISHQLILFFGMDGRSDNYLQRLHR